MQFSNKQPTRDKNVNQNTYFEKSGLLSRFFLFYCYKVISLGNKKVLTFEDIPKLNDNLEFGARFDDFYAYYCKKKKLNWQLMKIIFFYILPIWIYLLLGHLISNLLSIVYPFALKALINWFNDPEASITKGYLLCSAIFAVAIIKPFLQEHAARKGHDTVTIEMGIFFGMYFKKLENISIKAAKYLNIGKITSSLSTDVLRVIFSTMTGHQLITSPLLITIYTVILIVEIGWVALLGIALLLIIMTFQVYLGKFGSTLALKKFIQSDARNKNVNSSVTGIKTIKFNAWEGVVTNQLDNIRREERRYAFQLITIRGLVDGFIFIMPLLCALVCIVVYQSIYSNIDLGTTFYIIFIFNLFTTPLRVFFFALIQTYEATVAIKRMEQTLIYPDQTDEDDLTLDDASLKVGECKILKGTFSYDDRTLKAIYERQINNKKDILETTVEPVLYDIELGVKQGEFVAVIGEVGCGKSSLLKALSKALFINKGEVKKNGTIAYIPQEAFLANATLKDNIIIGSEYYEEFYQKVINKCELESDISMLPAGDLTEIGERGINLSGGQKQRVTIARAIYADCDIYLIDDSLSALDAHVGQQIFSNVFKGMIAKKTKIMVTHALQYLKDVDRVIFMEKGRIVDQGNFNDMLKNNQAFRIFVSEKQKKEKSSMMEDQNMSKNNTTPIDEKIDQLNLQSQLHEDNFSNAQQEAQITSGLILADGLPENEHSVVRESIEDTKGLEKHREPENLEEDGNNDDMKLNDIGKITRDEARFTGQVQANIYRKYFKEGGYLYTIFNLILFSIGITGRIMADWWVGQWNSDSFGLSNITYILYYLMIALITLAALISRAFSWGDYTSRVSYNIFKRLIYLVFRKRMSYFDTTPTGQILNLTSKDTDFVDINVPGTFMQAISLSLQTIGTFVLIGMTNLILIPFLFLIIICSAYVLRLYLKASMELRRLEQLSYSPILSNILELYNGLVVYRGFNKIEYVSRKYNYNVNRLLKVFYVDRLCQVFTTLCIEMFLALLIGLVFYLLATGKINAWGFVVKNTSVIALSLNWILVIPLTIHFFMIMIAETAKGMSSVQRLFKNVNEDDLERSYDVPKAPQGWPTEGGFDAHNVNVRYREGLPLVLHGLSFTIDPAEKIGIVGRTGSGKSSLILTLTRLLELADEESGYIKLDGVPINSIGLKELRKNMKVIPQDPLLIKGALRMNIDPYNDYSDEVVVEALKRSLIWDSGIFKSLQPKITISNESHREEEGESTYTVSDQDKLNFAIEEGGKNLSIGQKQLICIARALVSCPKVLLMDEATSNIDPNTDLKLQEIIKRQFINSTIITIAHRLNTIIHYDRIFVFSDGKLIEEGAPLDLLQRASNFREMVREHGKEFEKKMLKCAMDKNMSLIDEFSVMHKE